MDPLKPDDVQKAQSQQVSGAAKGTAFFITLGVLNQVFPGTVDSYGLKGLLEFLSATHRKPTGYVPKVSPYIVGYLLPAPIGTVPPEFFGLAPDYIGRLGSGSIPKSHFLATEATEERTRVFETSQRLKELIEEKREVRTFAENLTGGTGRPLYGQFQYSQERLARGNVAQLLDDLAFLKSLPTDLPRPLTRIAGFHSPLTGAKVADIIEDLEQDIRTLTKNDITVPAGWKLLIPGEPIPQGGSVITAAGREYFVPAPPSKPLPDAFIDFNNPSPKNPLPVTALPAYPLQKEAAKTANEVVRNISTEFFDP